MKKKPANPYNRLFVRLCGRKQVYQMYLQDDALLLCRVGDVRNGIDESLVQSADVPLCRPAKHDIVLWEKDAVRIRYVQRKGEKIVRIRMLHRFLELQPFQSDKRLVFDVMGRFAAHAHSSSRKEKYTSRAYPILRIAVPMLAMLSLLLFFVSDNIIANIALFPIVLALYCCFPGELTLIDTLKRQGRRYEYNPPKDISRQVCHGRINIMLTLIFSALLACGGSAHHNIISDARLYLFAAACAVILLMVVLVFTFDWRDQKSCMIVLLMVLLIYSYGTTAALNRALDHKPVITESAVVIDKYSSGSTKARNRKIVVHTESGEERYEVSVSQYQAAQAGDEVLICRHQGWLDIPYVIIQLP